MFYKVKRESELGKKFLELQDKMDKVVREAVYLQKEIGTSGHYPDRWSLSGGIEYVTFDEEPDMKVWKRVKEGGVSRKLYSPRLNNKEGKEIQKKLDELPRVTFKEINDLCGVEEVFGHAGISFENDVYVLYEIREDWKFTKPEEAEEITMSEFLKLGKEREEDE